MNIDIQSDPEHSNPRPPVKPPTDFTSRAIRLRLIMLFGMLLAVLLLMYEARKPERWEWMGFGEVNPNRAVDPVPNPDNPPANAAKSDNNSDDGTLAATPIAADSAAVEKELTRQADKTAYPVEAVRFWHMTFVRYKTERQKQLFQLFRFIRNGTSPDAIKPEQLESFKQLVKNLIVKRKNFHTELFNKISFLDNDESEKKNLNQHLFESKTLWEEKVLPGISDSLSGSGTTVSQMAAVERLQTVLDELALAQVADGETMKRPAEGMAWLRMWEQILESPNELYAPTTHIQLSSQPLAFRGRPIQIKGWVRSARKFVVPENEIGLSHYYILWMRPSDTNLAPYCVYTQELPSGFPHVTKTTIEMNEPATINGRFFKIHSYADAKDQIANCPLVLAKTFSWSPIVTNPVSTIDNWTPPRWAIIAAFVGLPLIAAGIAWIAFRNTQTRRFEPGEKTQKSIRGKLVDLGEDKSVQTDLEKVNSLYDLDDQD